MAKRDGEGTGDFELNDVLEIDTSCLILDPADPVGTILKALGATRLKAALPDALKLRLTIGQLLSGPFDILPVREEGSWTSDPTAERSLWVMLSSSDRGILANPYLELPEDEDRCGDGFLTNTPALRGKMGYCDLECEHCDRDSTPLLVSKRYTWAELASDDGDNTPWGELDDNYDPLAGLDLDDDSNLPDCAGPFVEHSYHLGLELPVTLPPAIFKTSPVGDIDTDTYGDLQCFTHTMGSDVDGEGVPVPSHVLPLDENGNGEVEIIMTGSTVTIDVYPFPLPAGVIDKDWRSEGDPDQRPSTLGELAGLVVDYVAERDEEGCDK